MQIYFYWMDGRRKISWCLDSAILAAEEHVKFRVELHHSETISRDIELKYLVKLNVSTYMGWSAIKFGTL